MIPRYLCFSMTWNIPQWIQMRSRFRIDFWNPWKVWVASDVQTNCRIMLVHWHHQSYVLFWQLNNLIWWHVYGSVCACGLMLFVSWTNSCWWLQLTSRWRKMVRKLDGHSSQNGWDSATKIVRRSVRWKYSFPASTQLAFNPQKNMCRFCVNHNIIRITEPTCLGFNTLTHLSHPVSISAKSCVHICQIGAR